MEDDINKVQKSYGSCCMSAGFFDDFYQIFLASSPEIAPMFKNTNFDKQKKLLRDGINFLIMFAKGSATANGFINKLGQSHSKNQWNVRPEMYPLWVDSLMKTVRKHDAGFNLDVEKSWRTVIEKGISVMKSMY